MITMLLPALPLLLHENERLRAEIVYTRQFWITGLQRRGK